MAYDEEFAQILRDALSDLDNITERKMFGGLCIMHNGNMLCGIANNGGIARVGKEREELALRYKGITPLSFTGRKMGGMVDISEAALRDSEILDEVLALAKEFVCALPAK